MTMTYTMRITHLSLLVLITAMPSLSVSALKRCPDCGHTQVPYPLSTAPNCGDQSYKLRCDSGTLWFDSTVNGSSYPVTSVNPALQRLVVQPPGLANDGTCTSRDYRSGGMWLDPSSPFNITSSNTVILMNCSREVLTLLWNCSSASICHVYVKGNAAASKACGASSRASQICCEIKTGGSGTAYRIRVREERCAAYASFPNLDSSLPERMWRPGVEIEWAVPSEPSCKAAQDCLDLANSGCSPDPVTRGARKCLCKAGFQWDPVNGICRVLDTKCHHGRGCKGRKKTALIGGLALVGAAMLGGTFITASAFYLRKQRIKNETQQSIIRRAHNILNGDNNTGKSAKVFTIKEITRATHNFSKANLLGAGGFGEVFKGVLDDGTITAIKRAKLGNTQAVDQIINEVKILCQVNHRSLVRLLGCCVDLLHEPFLVYEYVPNGTLFDHIHNKISSAKWAPLGWNSRLRIAQQTAEGIAYLHDAAVPKIYHRDIKSSNILLDANLDAKVSDFGISRLAASEASHVTTCAQGTLGYLDPEYYVNFQLTDKSDVYSFGVVMLELLTSKKAIDFNREEEDVNLVVMVKRTLKEGRLMDVVDPVLRSGACRLELENMKAFGALAAACLDDRRHNRPSMKEVSNEIEYIVGIVNDAKGGVLHV